jgi:hypothetical protein
MSRRATKNLPHDEWLTVRWGRLQGEGAEDILFSGPRRCDRSLMYGVLCLKPVKGEVLMNESLINELKARGYDTTTLEFRIKRKATAAGGVR